MGSVSIDQWSVNDTTRFAIDTSGCITSAGALAVGTYGLSISASDPYENTQSASLTIIIELGTTLTPAPGSPFIIALVIGIIAVIGVAAGGLLLHRRRQGKS